MSEAPASSSKNVVTQPGPSTQAVSEIDFSCRLPLLVFFISAAIWLVIGSAFELISTLKFHKPDLLADVSWLSYGRVHPAYNNALLYGFCLQAGFGVGLWLLARLGRTPLVHRWLVTIGAMLWNLGVTVGVLGILAGDNTGFENLEMPHYAALPVFFGYLFIGLWGVLTFHRRRERQLFVSQWFIFTALFWFPWIYSTANLLLIPFPLRGVTQAVIDWWFSQNLLGVWLGLVGLGTVFYFVPKMVKRELHSHYLALIAFWLLILFDGWGGIPNTAPVPAWMPTVSTIASIFLIVPVIAVALNVYQTIGRFTLFVPSTPALSFVLFGVVSFILYGVIRALGALLDVNQVLHLTWYTPALTLLNSYGFFTMVMFGAIYYIVPQFIGIEFPSPKLVRAHFWVAAAGVVLSVLPLLIAGIVQANQFLDAKIPFDQITKSSLMFLRVSTLGDLLLLLGHLFLLRNLVGLTGRFYRARATAAYEEVTADLFKTAGAKP
jgi:cytochrome c oxidase cbb3-type subunit 1